MSHSDPALTLEEATSPKYASATVSKPLPLGTPLLSDSALIAIPLEDEKPLRCSQCLLSAQDEGSVVLCEKCRCEGYCSYTCKTKAWKQYHSRLCPHLPAIQSTLESESFLESTVHAGLLLLRLVATYFYEESENLARLLEVQGLGVEEIRPRGQMGGSGSSRIETFFELLPRPLDKQEEEMLDIVTDKLEHIPRDALRFLLERFSGNNHVISDERLRPIGHAILPEISRACNHSCVPTGVISTGWNRAKQEIQVCVKTLRPLKAGEELTIPYLDPILPLQQRQTFLQQRYGFTCTCSLCTFQSNLKQPSRDRLQPHPEDLTQLYQLVVGKGISFAISLLKSLFPPNPTSATKLSPSDIIRSSLPLPSRVSLEKVPQPLHYCFDSELVTELTGMFAEAGEKGEWRVAYMAGLHVLGVYVPFYGWRFPLVALHLLELAKIIHNAHLSSPASSSLSRDSAPEMLLQATVYLSWAREALACSVAEGGSLAGEGEKGGPRAEVGMLQAASEEEWKLVLS